MQDLPTEIAWMICDYLPYLDVGCLGLTSHHQAALCLDEDYWQRRLLSRYGLRTISEIPKTVCLEVEISSDQDELMIETLKVSVDCEDHELVNYYASRLLTILEEAKSHSLIAQSATSYVDSFGTEYSLISVSDDVEYNQQLAKRRKYEKKIYETVLCLARGNYNELLNKFSPLMFNHNPVLLGAVQGKRHALFSAVVLSGTFTPLGLDKVATEIAFQGLDAFAGVFLMVISNRGMPIHLMGEKAIIAAKQGHLKTTLKFLKVNPAAAPERDDKVLVAALKHGQRSMALELIPYLKQGEEKPRRTLEYVALNSDLELVRALISSDLVYPYEILIETAKSGSEEFCSQLLSEWPEALASDNLSICLSFAATRSRSFVETVLDRASHLFKKTFPELEEENMGEVFHLLGENGETKAIELLSEISMVNMEQALFGAARHDQDQTVCYLIAGFIFDQQDYDRALLQACLGPSPKVVETLFRGQQKPSERGIRRAMLAAEKDRVTCDVLWTEFGRLFGSNRVRVHPVRRRPAV